MVNYFQLIRPQYRRGIGVLYPVDCELPPRERRSESAARARSRGT